MNVKLLKQVRDYIKDHPEEYDQDNWCGTSCCIAGHVLALSGKAPRQVIVEDSLPKLAEYLNGAYEVDGFYTGPAADTLGINQAQSNRLFLNWPERFRDALDDAATPSKRSAIAVKRINHFIKTKGAE